MACSWWSRAKGPHHLDDRQPVGPVHDGRERFFRVPVAPFSARFRSKPPEKSAAAAKRFFFFFRARSTTSVSQGRAVIAEKTMKVALQQLVPWRQRLRLSAGDLLRDPTYRRLWTSIMVSSLGGQVTMLALPLTAAVLLHATPTQMGLLTAMEIAPFVLFSLPSGVWLDRVRSCPCTSAARSPRAHGRQRAADLGVGCADDAVDVLRGVRARYRFHDCRQRGADRTHASCAA
jgi:hypothetical protein